MSVCHRYESQLVACLALSLAGGASLFSVSAAEPTAAQLMRREHDGRAVWTAFPGFTAELVATQDMRTVKGTIAVSAKGELNLQLDRTKGLKWIHSTLASVVHHRLSAHSAKTDVKFADENTAHPLGRLIRSQRPAENSLWRVKDDVLTEVHHVRDQTRTIISVVEVTRNPEGQHLPRSYAVTAWNTATGAIESSRQVFNEWQRIGGYDLPTRLLAATSKADGSRVVEEIVLSNHRLAESKLKVSELTPLDAPVTSFGAAAADGYLYVYGGHLGSPHDYSADLQANKLLRLNLNRPERWETVAEGARRTGLAMVSYQGSLYRIGGWEAKNAGGEKWNLHSMRDFARYDAKIGRWEDLAPLPRGRSSHDAAVVGSKLYVVGGWELAGEGSGDWHVAAYVCDLSEAEPQWQEIAKPPFQRRALAVAGHTGKLYVVGGMDDSNETTTAVAIYDPTANAWSQGPNVPGAKEDGFGMSACGTDAGLFASTRTGAVYRLSDDGEEWTAAGKLNHPRYFHRLLAAGDQRLIVVGGTSRAGKVSAVEMLELRDARVAARQ